MYSSRTSFFVFFLKAFFVPFDLY